MFRICIVLYVQFILDYLGVSIFSQIQLVQRKGFTHINNLEFWPIICLLHITSNWFATQPHFYVNHLKSLAVRFLKWHPYYNHVKSCSSQKFYSQKTIKMDPNHNININPNSKCLSLNLGQPFILSQILNHLDNLPLVHRIQILLCNKIVGQFNYSC